MKIHSVLIVIENPTDPKDESWTRWREMLKTLESIRTRTKEIEKFSENVWLLPLQNNLRVLNELLHETDDFRLKYRVLFLKKKPQWIRSHQEPT